MNQAGETFQCDICGAAAGANDLIELEGQRVCGNCKPAKVQQVKEGAGLQIPMMDLSERQSFVSILRAGGTLFVQEFPLILMISILIGIPNNLPFVLMPDETLRDVSRQIRAYQFAYVIFGFLASIAVAIAVERRLTGQPLPPWQTIWQAMRRWPAGIGTVIVAGILLLLLFLLLIVPGIIWYGFWIFSIYVVALRGMAGKAALDYSKSLVKGRWWRTMLFACGFIGVSLVPVILLTISTETAAAAVPGYSEFAYSPAGLLGQSLLEDIAFRFGEICLVILFLNMERLHQLAAAPPDLPPAETGRHQP